MSSQEKLKEHNLIKVEISNLKFDKTNPNKLTQDQMKGLRESMHKFGYLTPIIIDQDFNIADGEHRALIYKEFGLKEIPAYKIDLNDDIERRMLRQVMNKLHGEHDPKLDADELAKIFEGNRFEELSKMIAVQQDELKRLVNRYHPEIAFSRPEEFEQVTEEQFNKMVPNTELGDIYQLGNHRLICADSTDKRSILKLLDGKEKVDLVFTDPPYNIDFHYEEYDDKKSKDDYIEFCQNWFSIIKKVSNRIIITPGPRNVGLWWNIEEPTDIATWYKANSYSWASIFYQRTCEPILFYGDGFKEFIKKERANRKISRDFYEIIYEHDQITRKIETEQQIQNYTPYKPLKLVTKLIQDFSKNDEIVLDIFSGLGTSIISSEQLGRQCYAMEINPRYCDVAVKRWEKYTGKKAEKIS